MPTIRRNSQDIPSALVRLEDIDSERFPLASSNIQLTPEERECLSDRDWVTEAEADAIIAQRRDEAEGHRARPLREYLKSRGYRVED
jgi:hypothetical protein